MIGLKEKDLTKNEKEILKLFGIPNELYFGETATRFVYLFGDNHEFSLLAYSKGEDKGKVEVKVWPSRAYFTTPKKAVKDFRKFEKIMTKRDKSMDSYYKQLQKITKGKKKAD